MNKKQRKARLKYLNSLPKEIKKKKRFAKQAKLIKMLLPKTKTTTLNKAVYCKDCLFNYVTLKGNNWCSIDNIADQIKSPCRLFENKIRS